MARRYGAKRDFAPEHVQALDEISKIINRLGFSKDDLAKARQELSKYMPKEVFLDKYGNEDGWALLYALYAPQIVNDFFKEEKRSGEKRQSPKSRRLQYQELGGDAMDYVQSVFMGYHDDQEQLVGGVRSVAMPIDEDSAYINKYVYDPKQDGSRPGICPHCHVSFWTMSAGNGDPKYEMIRGEPLPDWRDNPLEAPEHIRFNPQTEERQESGGYSYCGGRQEIFDITNPEGGIDIETAERISRQSWDDLRAQNRIRTIHEEGGIKYYLVDQLLNAVEDKLGGDAAYKRFSADWIFEEDGKLYRECRHPITLKSPASVIYDRIAKYTYNVSEKGSLHRAHTIKVYMCPNCPGEFKDINGITTGKDGREKVTTVQCDECGSWFDIEDLSDEMKYSMKWIDKQTSLNISSPNEEGRQSQLIDAIESRDVGQLEVDVSEILDIFHEEIDKISRDLNIRGAQYARDVFEDWVISGLDLKAITEKYFTGIYKLHFTECLDCGARTGVDTDPEKSNPNEDAKARYDQGLPVTMTQCPRRNADPRHQVVLPAEETPAQEEQVEEVNAWSDVPPEAPPPQQKSDIFESGQVPSIQKERPQEAVQQDQINQAADQLDDDQRRRYYGLNLVYHGRAPEGSRLPGISYLLIDQDSSQALPTEDPRSYKGGEGVITRHIYAPAQRLIKAILEALQNNPRIRDKHHETMDVLNELAEKSWAETRRIARVRSFCRVS